MAVSTRLLVGTTKGAFILTGTSDRDGWSVSGPHCDGWCINHMVGDATSGHIWAGGGGEWEGAGIWRSEDGGETWTVARLSKGQRDDWAATDPDFAEMIGWEPWEAPFDTDISQIWSLGYGHGTLYAGTKPATLLTSTDDGQPWAKVQRLNDHPSAKSWNPGGAGLVLHTIVFDPSDPAKLWLGISAAGVFATDDGGQSWERRNRLSNAEACGHHDHPAAPKDGETGHCVHNIVRGPDDLLYQQNHHGVYRSPDGGRSWDDITAGLPSTFGFPIALNPHDPQMIWTLPLNGARAGRYPPDASAAVWIAAVLEQGHWKLVHLLALRLSGRGVWVVPPLPHSLDLLCFVPVCLAVSCFCVGFARGPFCLLSGR